jgi:phosphotransferase system enzyme I (PtsI)
MSAARPENTWVGMCGEMAGDPAAITALLGLGLDDFSMGAALIPDAKALTLRLTLAKALGPALEVLA